MRRFSDYPELVPIKVYGDTILYELIDDEKYILLHGDGRKDSDNKNTEQRGSLEGPADRSH